ncbi:MAG: hypothetical protein K8R85_03300 [Bacteroidetes bacterium]|nr:hypothetical protein [Bacteroidota bacterium]
MKIKLKILFCFFCAVFLNSCEYHRYNEVYVPQPVNYTVLKKSSFFNEKNISFSIDSLNNVLYVRLTVNGLKIFPFPVDKKSKDTLFKTAFNFVFYSDSKIIVSDYPVMKNTFRYFIDTLATAKNMSFSTDTVDLRNSNDLLIQIPFYAFHNLKRGKHIIELAVSQALFTDEVSIVNTDNSSRYVHAYATKPLINARVKFEIVVPPIYKSIIYGLGLELKNDSSFSPAGMDNTIWKSSYPDIYWAILYPKNEFYAQTPYETSTAKYVGHDTFNLYHYHVNDSIGFGVYDHDYLSRDDGLGYCWGSLNNLKETEYKRLKFGNVHHFDLKVKDGKMVNW